MSNGGLHAGISDAVFDSGNVFYHVAEGSAQSLPATI